MCSWATRHRSAYDSEQRFLGRTKPLGPVSSNTYDATGHLTTSTDFDGQVTRYDYDAANHLTREVFADGTEVDYTYTPTGQRATASDARGMTTYGYDARGRLTSVVNPDGSTIRYASMATATGRPSGPRPGMTTYSYDALNRIATVTDPSGGLTRYFYDADGELIRTDFPNGASEIRTYTPSRLSTQVLIGAAGTLSGETYTYDFAGNETSRHRAERSCRRLHLRRPWPRHPGGDH